MKLISLIQIAGSSTNQRSLNKVASAFLSRKDRSDSARRVDQYTSEVTVKPYSIGLVSLPSDLNIALKCGLDFFLFKTSFNIFQVTRVFDLASSNFVP